MSGKRRSAFPTGLNVPGGGISIVRRGGGIEGMKSLTILDPAHAAMLRKCTCLSVGLEALMV
jgi:hypothetical protein